MARKKNVNVDSIDLQKIRLSALDLQVRALKYQAQALRSIGAEHTSGLDIGCCRHYGYLEKSVETFVQYVKEFLTVADTMPAEEAQAWLTKMAAWKNTLAADAVDEQVCQSANAFARVKADIAGRPVNPVDEIPLGSSAQESSARSFCYSAEVAQLNTFSMQLTATCNLALEVALTAAAEANKKREAQAAKK